MSGKQLFFTLGRPFAPCYGAMMRLRELLYRKRLFRVTRFPVPVVSVGNLTLGGTGKTPMVQYLARLFQRAGLRPAVVSRGYGGSTRERVNLVSDGQHILLDAAFAGDEPRFLAETLPGVEVLTGVVRVLPAAEAVRRGAEVLVLDDGMQHLAVGRDLDIALFQADTLAGNSRVFPGGDLREPVAALGRCHAFVLTGVHAGNRERAASFADLLTKRFPRQPVFFAGYSVQGFVEPDGTGRLRAAVAPPDAGLAGFAFCGIARPEGFRRTLESMGLSLGGFLSLGDHHRYGDKDLALLLRQAARAGAGYLITTEKDLVKFLHAEIPLPIFGLRMTVELPSAFDELVLERVRAGQVCRKNNTLAP